MDVDFAVVALVGLGILFDDFVADVAGDGGFEVVDYQGVRNFCVLRR